MSKEMDQRAKARRIAENAGEEDESKKREKLQWMYGQKENDEEEYLLGEHWASFLVMIWFRLKVKAWISAVIVKTLSHNR